MQGYNCIMVYSQDCKKLLFCRRMKDPYKGLYNLVVEQVKYYGMGVRQPNTKESIQRVISSSIRSTG
jgi:hypothetical protein